MKQLLQFALAGAIGFMVDAGVLMLMHQWLGPYVGRFVSFACAVVTTWLINRSLTFRHQSGNKPLHREFSLYFTAMLAGGGVNIACYSIMVHYLDLSMRALPLAVAVGSVAGMMVNFWLSHSFVFTERTTKTKSDA